MTNFAVELDQVLLESDERLTIQFISHLWPGSFLGSDDVIDWRSDDAGRLMSGLPQDALSPDHAWADELVDRDDSEWVDAIKHTYRELDPRNIRIAHKDVQYHDWAVI